MLFILGYKNLSITINSIVHLETLDNDVSDVNNKFDLVNILTFPLENYLCDPIRHIWLWQDTYHPVYQWTKVCYR